jgi:Putative restriction endonuclease
MVSTTAAEPWVERHWPPDDTEESIVGSEYHQHVIDAVRDGLRMAARANEASWHVLSQVPIAGFRHPNGAPYAMLPDVFVHPLANPRPASGQVLTFPEVGVPLLAIEVLSATTYRQDLDEESGKPWSYAEAGVAEYLAVDYDRQYMAEPVKALRLAEGRWTPWPRDAAGRWASAQLGVSFAFDGLYLRVYDAAGRLKPLPDEADAMLRDRDDRLRRARALLEAGDLEALRDVLESGESN